MDSTRFQRPRYVHRRAGSGNETATLDALQASTSVSIDTQVAVTTHSSEESTATLPATISSQTTIKEGSLTSSATSASSAVSTIPTTSSVVPEKTPTTTSLPTSIASSGGSSLAPVVIPTSLVIPDAVPSGKPASSSARQLVQVPPNAATQPAPPVPSTAEAPNQPAPPVPVTASTSASASVPAPVSTSAISSVSTTKLASTQLPSSISPEIPTTTGTEQPSLLLDTSMQTASMSSIPVPSFVSMSTTLSDATSASALPSVSKAFQLQSSASVSASASTTLAPAPVGASTDSPQTSAPASSTPQGSNMTTIVGAAVGSVAGFVLLALLGIWFIRRRYRNTSVIMSPFSRRHSGRDRVPLSPGSMNEGFRPDPKTLFSKGSYSTFDEKESASSSRSYTPPNRHSRSYTTNSLPPVVPARSVARPLSTVQQPPANLKSTTTPPLTYKAAEPMDTSFMGTISTYFSSTPTITEEPFDVSTTDTTTNNKTTSSSTSSIYTQNSASPAVLSPHASFLPPITPNLPPSTTTTTQTSTTPSPPPPSISPPIPPIPSPPHASASPLASSRYQSMGMGMGAGAWRDSMWSTSATPIVPAHLPPGTATSTYNYNFFDASRPASTQHRASRSLGDVIDWKTDFGNASSATMAGSEKIGTAQSLYSPPLPSSSSSSPITPPLPVATLTPAPLVIVPVPEGPLAIPPRSPLRSWPLRGN